MTTTATEELEAMSLKELADLFNRITTTVRITRFKTKEVGRARCAAELALRAAMARLQTTTSTPAGKRGRGRPRGAYTVRARTEAETKLHKRSLRAMVLEFVRSRPEQCTTTAEIETAFGIRARGAVQKLANAGWLAVEAA